KNFHDFTSVDLTCDNHRELAFTGAVGQPLAIFQRAAEGYRDISSTFLENPTDAYATEKFAIGHLDLNGDGSSDLSIGGGYPAPDLDSPSTALGQNHLYLVNRGNGTGLLSRLSQPLPKSTKSLLA